MLNAGNLLRIAVDARQLAEIAWEEFKNHAMGQVSDDLAKAQSAYDTATDHGYTQQPGR